MNWLSNLLGSPDGDLIRTGELARGNVLAVTATGMTMQIANGLVERKCELTVRVYRNGLAPYDTTTTQRVQEVYIPQLASGGAWVAVRVDPADPRRIVVDFSVPAPEVQVAAGEGETGAAWILANGTPVEAILVQAQPLDMTGPTGDRVYAVTATIIDGDAAPYQVQVGNAVPAAALPLLYPGSRLPARRGSGTDDIVIDFAAALAQSGGAGDAAGSGGAGDAAAPDAG